MLRGFGRPDRGDLVWSEFISTARTALQLRFGMPARQWSLYV